MAKTAAQLASAAAYMARRRAATRAAKAAYAAKGEAYVEPTLQAVYERDEGVCYICGCHTSPLGAAHKDNNRPTMDHVVPLSCGGLHEMNNLRLCCYTCNRRKSVDTIVEMVAKLNKLG